MIKENKEIYEKLISFGVEKLANILIKLSEENDVVENYIKSITSTDKENVKRFTKELNKLKRRKRFIEWDKSRDFAEELENILEILESGVTDSIIGIELIIAFFEMDSKHSGYPADTRASPVSPARFPVALSSTAQSVKPCSA